MSNFTLPRAVEILGATYSVMFETAPNMDGCVASVNIGRKFASDEAAEEFGFSTIGGIDGVDSFAVSKSGDVSMRVNPR